MHRFALFFLPAILWLSHSDPRCAAWSGDTPQTESQKVEFVVYKIAHKPVDEIEKLLRPLVPANVDYQLFSDKRENKLYLRGSKEAHNIVSQLIHRVDRPAIIRPFQKRSTSSEQDGQRDIGSTIEPRKPNQLADSGLEPFRKNDSRRSRSIAEATQPLDEPSNTESTITRFVLLNQAMIDPMEKQILGIFSSSLNVVKKDEREIYVIPLKNPSKLEVEFDRKRNGILIGGPKTIVSQMVTLCDALVENQKRGPSSTKILRVQKQNQGQIRQLVQPPNKVNPKGSFRYEPSRIQPAEFVFQEDGKADSPPKVQTDDPPPAIQQFEGVEIETMPDLDVIILRGREQDLQKLEEIIKQIERISQETQPVIQLYQLRHTLSDSLADIIDETGEDLVGGRQGKITVTPLAKPNALLLIGWGDAVSAILELIRQLDVPVDAKSQFRVFRIRHASAEAINTNIEQFFSGRGQLGPAVTGIVDARTNSIVVYAAPRDMTEVARMVSELDVPGGMAVNRTQIIPIKNSLAADVAQTLQSAITSASSDSRTAIMELMAFNEKGQKILKSGSLNDVQITPNLRNNTLIVSSPKENLDLIQELIRQLDTPASRSQLKIFKIYNSDASNVVQTLRSLIPGSTSAANDLKLPTAPDEISLTPLRFSVDVRSNSILATGSEGDLRIAEALIAKLDESTSSQRKTEVYPLKNSPAVDVANAINQFLQSSRQLDNAAPGAQNPFQELEREVIVVPEPIANKLLVSATSRYFDEISNLIEKLDEQPAQVMIQVLIAEVDLNDADEFGVELGLQDSVLFDRSLLGDLLTTKNSVLTAASTVENEVIQAASNIPGFNFNNTLPLGNSGSLQALQGAGAVGAQGISNFAVGRSNKQMDFGGLVLSASSQNVSILLRAMQESRRLDILSRPQVRTLDNQPAFIQVGERVPRIVGSTVNQNGQSNSVTLENIGLILAVTPRISPDGTVVMEIDAEKSDLGTEQDGIPVAVSTDGTVIRSPRVDTTTAQATVSAADGETIVLGGLITKRTDQTHRSVPYLNRVPLLKNFFKYDGSFVARTELLIILTPRIIRSAEDNAKIRQIETARINWCAADVFEMHGEIDAIEDISPEQLDAAEPQVIYPVENPRGEILKPIRNGSPARTALLPNRFRRGGMLKGFRQENTLPAEAPPLGGRQEVMPPIQNLPE